MFLAAAIVIRPFAGQWVGKYSNKRFWCSLLWLFGDYRAVSSLPFYRVAALYPRTSWDYVWCYYHGKRNYFSAVNSGLPTWRGHQLFLFSDGPAMVVGPWIGLNMARWDAFTAAFWLCSAVAALEIVLSLIVTVPPVIRHADGSKPNLGFSAMFDRAALPFALVTFL